MNDHDEVREGRQFDRRQAGRLGQRSFDLGYVDVSQVIAASEIHYEFKSTRDHKFLSIFKITL
jgi:hypothetical protein